MVVTPVEIFYRPTAKERVPATLMVVSCTCVIERQDVAGNRRERTNRNASLFLDKGKCRPVSLRWKSSTSDDPRFPTVLVGNTKRARECRSRGSATSASEAKPKWMSVVHHSRGRRSDPTRFCNTTSKALCPKAVRTPVDRVTGAVRV